MKIPEGVTVEVKDGRVAVSGAKGTLERAFDSRVVLVEAANGEVTVKPAVRERRSVNASVKSIEAHLKNMFEGVGKGFQKKLAVIYAHFPITVESKGGEILIKNFLGEKSPRKAAIVRGVQVKVEKQEITVSGTSKEAVGQTAANIIKATNITKRDKRVFQDGIYVAE